MDIQKFISSLTKVSRTCDFLHLLFSVLLLVVLRVEVLSPHDHRKTMLRIKGILHQRSYVESPQ